MSTPEPGSTARWREIPDTACTRTFAGQGRDHIAPGWATAHADHLTWADSPTPDPGLLAACFRGACFLGLDAQALTLLSCMTGHLLQRRPRTAQAQPPSAGCQICCLPHSGGQRAPWLTADARAYRAPGRALVAGTYGAAHHRCLNWLRSPVSGQSRFTRTVQTSGLLPLTPTTPGDRLIAPRLCRTTTSGCGM